MVKVPYILVRQTIARWKSEIFQKDTRHNQAVCTDVSPVV